MNNARKAVVLDTSALISLQTAGLLDRCISLFDLIVPTKVVEELKEMSMFKDLEGAAAKSVLSKIGPAKIMQHSVADKNKVERLLSRDVDLGEAECFAVALEKNIACLVLDDVNAAYGLSGLAKAKGIELKISAAFVSELVKQGAISKKQGLSAVRKMVRVRGWEGGVLEYFAKKYFKI